jgi:TolA-binding protein
MSENLNESALRGGLFSEGATIMSDEIRELRDEIRNLRDVIIRVETLMGTMPEKLSDHEVRIRQLEKGKWPLPKLTVMISLVGLVAAIILPFWI